MDAISSSPDARPFVRRAPDADAHVRASLRAVGDALAAELGPTLVGLLLVGGYARGEGGVVWTDAGPQPYNDFDLVAVVRGDPRAQRERLRVFGEAWSRELGVAVDLWPVSRRALEAPPATLFWLDASLGGVRVLRGPDELLAGLRVRARDVPLEEAGRLLANRATGLALSRLERAPSDPTRPARHALKAVLAVGDAELLAANRYAPTVRARLAELQRLASLRREPARQALAAAYRAAADFRERPDTWRPPTPAFLDDARALVAERHLAFEARRAGTPATPLGFATSGVPVFPELRDARPVARLAARAGRLVGWLHPRERLARASVALAYGDDACRRAAAVLLGAPVAPPPSDAELHEALVRASTAGG